MVPGAPEPGLGPAHQRGRPTTGSVAAGPGGIVDGYDDVEYTQFQMTFINFFDQVWGAELGPYIFIRDEGPFE